MPAQQQVLDDTYTPVQSVTAWRSVPGFVRFAVWLWAIFLVIGVIVGVAGVVLTLTIGGSLLGGLTNGSWPQ